MRLQENRHKIRHKAFSCHIRPWSDGQLPATLSECVRIDTGCSGIRGLTLYLPLQQEISVLDEAKHIEYIGTAAYALHDLGNFLWSASFNVIEQLVQLLVLVFE